MEREKKLTMRQKQAMESRRRLLDAATELFNQNGFRATGVQDICNRAGLSVGVFYHYFPSKQELLQSILRSKDEELMELIAQESTARTHLEALLEVFGFVYRQKATESFAMECTFFTPPSSGYTVPDKRLLQFIASIVESAQATGELTTEISAEQIAFDLLISSRGYQLYWCESGGKEDLLSGQQAYLKRLLRAYLGPSGVIE